MSDNVIFLKDIKYYGDTPVKEMLECIAEDASHVFVVKWNKNGDLPTYHSSTSDIPVIMLRVQEFIHKFYNGDFKV